MEDLPIDNKFHVHSGKFDLRRMASRKLINKLSFEKVDYRGTTIPNNMLPISETFGRLISTPCSFLRAETPGWGITPSFRSSRGVMSTGPKSTT